MILSIKYFGLLAEVTGCSEEKIKFSGKSISDLKSILFQKHEELKNKDFQIAQNNELTTNESNDNSNRNCFINHLLQEG